MAWHKVFSFIPEAIISVQMKYSYLVSSKPTRAPFALLASLLTA